MSQNEVNSPKLLREVRTVSTLPDKELRELLSDLSPYILNRWMQHFADKEEYEVCQVIKETLQGCRTK